MIDSPASFAIVHPNIAYWLDEGMKLGAVGMGGLWTYWNYRKSRTYAQKLELLITASAFVKRNLYLEVSTGIRNLGASKYGVKQRGSVCEIVAIMADLSEIPVDFFPAFEQHDRIEPGESISDSHHCMVDLRPEDIVWLKVYLRVVSDEVEWISSHLLKVE